MSHYEIYKHVYDNGIEPAPDEGVVRSQATPDDQSVMAVVLSEARRRYDWQRRLIDSIDVAAKEVEEGQDDPG